MTLLPQDALAELVGEVKLCVIEADFPKAASKNKEKKELAPKQEKTEQANKQEKKEQENKREKKEAEPQKEKTASHPRKEKKEPETKHDNKESTVKKIEDKPNNAPVTTSTAKVSVAPSESKKSVPLDLLPEVTSPTC